MSVAGAAAEADVVEALVREYLVKNSCTATLEAFNREKVRLGGLGAGGSPGAASRRQRGERCPRVHLGAPTALMPGLGSACTMLLTQCVCTTYSLPAYSAVCRRNSGVPLKSCRVTLQAASSLVSRSAPSDACLSVLHRTKQHFAKLSPPFSTPPGGATPRHTCTCACAHVQPKHAQSITKRELLRKALALDKAAVAYKKAHPQAEGLPSTLEVWAAYQMARVNAAAWSEPTPPPALAVRCGLGLGRVQPPALSLSLAACWCAWRRG